MRPFVRLHSSAPRRLCSLHRDKFREISNPLSHNFKAVNWDSNADAFGNHVEDLLWRWIICCFQEKMSVTLMKALSNLVRQCLLDQKQTKADLNAFASSVGWTYESVLCLSNKKFYSNWGAKMEKARCNTFRAFLGGWNPATFRFRVTEVSKLYFGSVFTVTSLSSHNQLPVFWLNSLAFWSPRVKNLPHKNNSVQQ